MRNFSRIKIGSGSFDINGVYYRECSTITITGAPSTIHEIEQVLERPAHLWRIEFEGNGYRESIRGRFMIEKAGDSIILKKQ